jgi:hypothetical protein
MDYQWDAHQLSRFIVAAILLFAGCAPKVQRPMRVCPSAESAAAAISVQKWRLESAIPFRANGKCLLSYYDEQDKHKRENFHIKLWGEPPERFYLQGDVAFDPKGIVLGSNQREFWVSMKPKEISSYVWGQWSQRSCFKELAINPTLLSEALGIMELDTEEAWSFSNDGAFDILTEQQTAGITKKVYIYGCDHLVRRIEYCDASRKVLVVTVLGKYKPVSKDFWVPSVINIVRHKQDDRSDSMIIKLSSIKPVELTEKQRSRLFFRPEPEGFKHIYKLDENCDFIRLGGGVIEQPQ